MESAHASVRSSAMAAIRVVCLKDDKRVVQKITEIAAYDVDIHCKRYAIETLEVVVSRGHQDPMHVLCNLLSHTEAEIRESAKERRGEDRRVDEEFLFHGIIFYQSSV
eukprot:607155-Hanusia_phi.AAC.7